ncbi:MAG TPA: hypothetical protein V6C72_14210 [Chroococcales cyanobacterium]
MARKVINGVPIGMTAAWFALKHFLAGCSRAVHHNDRSEHVSRLRSAGIDVKALERNCHICGYAMASVPSAEGWQVQGCSATVVPRLVAAGSSFGDWCKRLPSSASSTEHTHDLQTSAR